MQEICFREKLKYKSDEGVFSALVSLTDNLFKQKYFEDINKTKFHFSDKINNEINQLKIGGRRN